MSCMLMGMNIDTELDTQAEDQVLNVLLEELEEAKAIAEKAEAKVKMLRDGITDQMRNTGKKRYTLKANGRTYNATLVHSRPVVIDFDSMIQDEVLTEQERELITKKEFSKKLLEDAVDSGEIKASVIAPYVSTPKEAYSVRYKSE